jgi:hypothetical protein
MPMPRNLQLPLLQRQPKPSQDVKTWVNSVSGSVKVRQAGCDNVIEVVNRQEFMDMIAGKSVNDSEA